MLLDPPESNSMSRPADPAAPTAIQTRSARLGDFTIDRGALRLIVMAPVVATAGTAAAWALLQLIALVTNLAYFGRLSTEAVDLGQSPWGIAAALVPPVGCLIIGLMARYGSEKIRGHGIPEAIEAILIGSSRIQPKVAVLKPLSSAVSIGTGGPFGAEGPIIMTGGALGSLFAQLFHLTAAERKTLLVADAAAGMTAIFGTPVAAVLLAVELLLFEWKPRSLIPVATAAIVAAAWRPLLFETGPLFAFSGMVDLSGPALLAVIGVGIAAGFGSGILTALVYGFEDLFEWLPVHWMWWPVLGGVAIGIGGLIEPAALGVGYDSIRDLLAGHLPPGDVLRLLVVKALLWSIALGSGTSGGVLAPLLIMGGALGALEGMVLPGGSGVWALLGMAAMMGGTMRSPLTAAVFAVELTGNLAMLPALLAACIAAYAVTVLLLKRSILTEKIARRGHHILREYIVDPFELTRVGDVMVAQVDTLPAAMPVDDAVAFFTDESGPRHKSYPVVDEAGRPVGMVARADVLRWMVSGWPRGTSLADTVSGIPLVLGHPDEMVGRVADRMAEGDAGRVPVTRREDGVLVGILARKDLLRVRARLRTEEIDRARLLRPGSQR
jgi:CIC family chloride channel protein